jgi:hypothetical protein
MGDDTGDRTEPVVGLTRMTSMSGSCAGVGDPKSCVPIETE